MGARSRRKGVAWEVAVSRRFREIGIACERNLEEVRSGNRGDLNLPRDLPISVQCKVGGAPPIYRAVKEAEEAAPPGHHPVAIIRRNGSGSRPPDDLAVMPLDSFMELVEALRASRWW